LTRKREEAVREKGWLGKGSFWGTGKYFLGEGNTEYRIFPNVQRAFIGT
jgi:hypothetical protein